MHMLKPIHYGKLGVKVWIIVEKFFLLRTLVKEENNNVTTKTCKISSSTSSKTTGRSKGGNYVTFGEYGLQATTTSWITSRQIESARIAMTRYMKRGGKVWIKIFPHTPYTKNL